MPRFPPIQELESIKELNARTSKNICFAANGEWCNLSDKEGIFGIEGQQRFRPCHEVESN